MLAELALLPWKFSPPSVEVPPRLEYEPQALSVLVEAVSLRFE